MGIVTLKSNDYFVVSLKKSLKITIISLLVTVLLKKVAINSLLVTVPLKKVSIISLLATVYRENVTIKSLLVTFPAR